MKLRIRFNPSDEELDIERRKYFAGLSYQEKLRYLFKTQRMFGQKSPILREDLSLCDKFPLVPYR